MVFSLPPLLLSRRLVGPVEFVAHCQIAIRMPQTRRHDPAADIGGAYGAVRDGASRSICVKIKGIMTPCGEVHGVRPDAQRGTERVSRMP